MSYKNVIGRLGKPRLKLIKGLCREKYGIRHHTAQEMLSVISENGLELYTPTGRLRPEKQIADAMSKAHKKLFTDVMSDEKKKGEHIITNPHS